MKRGYVSRGEKGATEEKWEEDDHLAIQLSSYLAVFLWSGPTDVSKGGWSVGPIICLPVYLFPCLSFYLSPIELSRYLSICLSVCLFVCLSTHLSIYLAI